MARRGTGVTIADVAREARVSPATVSRVMNGRFVGDPAVADRVRATAEEMRYRPNAIARNLALGRTGTVAFVVPDLANPAFQEVLSALSKAAARDGYRVLIADSGEGGGDEAQLALDIRHRCDSIVLCAPRMDDERLAEIVEELAPLVLINRAIAPAAADAGAVRYPSVFVDYAAGIRALAEHAHALGHRRFAYLAGPVSSRSNSRRLEGLAAFAEQHPDATIERIAAGSTAEEGRRASFAVRDSGATVVLAYNDLVAVGLLDGLGELGVAVPEQVSVAGFDDTMLARLVTPRLTTAAVPYPRLGEEAWARLAAVIADEPVPEDLTVTPELRARHSVTAAPVAG